MREQRMARRDGDPQWIAPGRLGNNTVADVGGLCEPHVVQIVVQPLELLGERDFIEVDGDLRVLLSAQCNEGGKACRGDAIGQRNTQLTVIACGDRSHAGAGLIQCSKHTWDMFEQQPAGPGQPGAARGARK